MRNLVLPARAASAKYCWRTEGSGCSKRKWTGQIMPLLMEVGVGGHILV